MKKTNPKLEALFASPPLGCSLEQKYGSKFFKSFEADLRAIVERAGGGPLPSVRAIRDYLNETYGVGLSYSTVYEHLNRIKKGA